MVSAQRLRAALRVLFAAPGAAVGSFLVALLLLSAVMSPVLFGHAAAQYNPQEAMTAPSSTHWLGTDELGRDVLARVLVATRTTVGLSLLAVALSTACGVLIGAVVSVLGRRARSALLQATSVAIAFPSVVVAMFISAAVGRSATSAVIGLAAAGIPATARVTVTLAASVGAADFVTAARGIGVRRKRLLARYVVPHVLAPVTVVLALSMSGNLVALSAFSFLGLGVQEPAYDWGKLLAGGVDNIYSSPAYVLGPSAAIVFAGIAFSVLGGSLTVVLDVKRRRRLISRRSATATPGPELTDGEAAPSPVAPAEETSEPRTVPCLAVSELRVRAHSAHPRTELVRGISLRVREGERLGIVGESGSGKSLTVSALGCVLPENVQATTAQHTFRGKTIDSSDHRAVTQRLGGAVSMVFQDPMSSLNPALTVRTQMTHKLRALGVRGRSQRRDAVLEALREVRLPDPQWCAGRRPHELSGGMRQRVMIALALLGDPAVILADEPTTALDATVQAEILALFHQINRDRGSAIVLVSHDLALVSQACDRVLVMYAGRIIEEGPVADVIAAPLHPYTRMLIGAVPSLNQGTPNELITIPGSPPDPAHMPRGCPFAPRCPDAMSRCTAQIPQWSGKPSHRAACWMVDGLGQARPTGSAGSV